uniref:Uncharacterized protein n=1 Tax=Trichogramma kaykai TaxID=54128 RepID=A0ABD2WNZ5_9HYME
MSKSIYCLKLFLFRQEFRKEFSLSAEEIDSLREICIFIILIYLRAWFTCSIAIQAPNNDLHLIKQLISYKQINFEVATKALLKLSEHVWYLGEDLIALSLFDDHVDIEMKKKICKALTNEESTIVKKRRKVELSTIDSFTGKDLSDFVSEKSLKLFEVFDLPSDFLDLDIELWQDSNEYKASHDFLKNLMVVNDVAERGIALIEDYNNCLTKNEKQLQYLLQIVREHRKRFPNCNKTTLSSL